MSNEVAWWEKQRILKQVRITTKKPSGNLDQANNDYGDDNCIPTCHLAEDDDICNRDEYEGRVDV